ncbi:uncharacterized protein DUF3934 [Paenibacillus methanolicus]|uniref:Uncharacterized protein DUF3934 n=1 Tax=Paenibacillus methanolicus TaxID=582686 RepID=A0A5S5BTJ9_9BACL|nr:uncharacterized protein DUF3934 [Paenibacillus methanolicus]
MSKAKGGTGRGTGKKGWNRWQKSANKAANAPKPYKSKGTKEGSAESTGAAAGAGSARKTAPGVGVKRAVGAAKKAVVKREKPTTEASQPAHGSTRRSLEARGATGSMMPFMRDRNDDR